MSSAAVAAAAMAALTASQAPGIEPARLGGEDDGHSESLPETTPGDDSYHTELPPLRSPAPPEESVPGGVQPDESGIPATVLAAYQKAEGALAASDPGCRLPWQLLAAIGKVESGQARGGAVDDSGTTLSPILGPQLNGQGFARIRDTDGGVHDGDTEFDRAVGPMQFIPSTWSTWAADGNGDGRKDPNNIYDAALAAGEYLCHGERDLAVKADLDRAILSYNHSTAYLRTVLAWLEFYRDGVHKVPDGTGVLPTSPGAGDGGGAGPGGKNGKVGKEEDGGKKGENTGGGGGDGDGTGKSPQEPGEPGGDEESDPPSGGGPGSGTDESPSPGDPTNPGDDPDVPTDPDDVPTDPVDDQPAVLKPAGDTVLTVTAGQTVPAPYGVSVETADGRPAADSTVRYEIVGTTDTRFPRGSRIVEVPADGEGGATAPELRVGQRTGDFRVVASVPGHGDVPAAEFTTTVEPAPEPQADQLERVDQHGAFTVNTGEVCPALQIWATDGGAPAEGVAVTATVLSGTGEELEPGAGPTFTGPDGTRVHTLEKLRTDADGRLTLPELAAGEDPGDYRLRLTTPGSGELTVSLTVEKPSASGEPSPEPSAS